MLRRPWMLVLLATLSAPAFAQAPAPASPSPETPAAIPQPDLGRSLVEGEIAPLPGGYAYTSQGRRDPFVSLLKPVESNPGSKTRPPGIQGFLIQEVALKGIVKGPKGYTAMLLATNNQSFFVTTGQRLFDGVVTAIDASSVTFRQEVTDPLSTVKSRDVKKSLYPSEEGR
jgi:Tfp pilus assembly protein PilP